MQRREQSGLRRIGKQGVEREALPHHREAATTKPPAWSECLFAWRSLFDKGYQRRLKEAPLPGL
jgi:hypothetical protein